MSYTSERYEVIRAGRRVLRSMELALEQLDKASGWGALDIIGGGLVTSLIKRDKLKKANEYIEEATVSLRQFNKELDAGGMVEDLKIETSGFLSVTDYLFDNIVSDVVLQTKIEKTIKNIENAMDKIEKIVELLERQPD